MAKTKEKTQEIISTYKKSDSDTGSSEVQIALFTERITYLTNHIKTHPKDNHSRRGLITLVNKRRKLLDYLKKIEQPRYEKIIKELKIRK